MANDVKLSNLAAAACAGDGSNLGLLPLLAGGKLHFYDGTKAADPDTAKGSVNDYDAATVVTFPTPAGSESNGIITFGTIVDGVCSYGGTPTWVRLHKADNTTALVDCTVGVSGCDINCATFPWVSGGAIHFTSLSLTIPPH